MTFFFFISHSICQQIELDSQHIHTRIEIDYIISDAMAAIHFHLTNLNVISRGISSIWYGWQVDMKMGQRSSSSILEFHVVWLEQSPRCHKWTHICLRVRITSALIPLSLYPQHILTTTFHYKRHIHNILSVQMMSIYIYGIPFFFVVAFSTYIFVRTHLHVRLHHHHTSTTHITRILCVVAQQASTS